MMNFYGDDRQYIDGNYYKKATITEKIADLFGKLSPINLINKIDRANKVKKVQKEIENVKYTNTEELKKIIDTIERYGLYEPKWGKIISQQHVENLITKVIQNDNKLLNDDKINYYLNEKPKKNKEYIDLDNYHKLSSKIKRSFKNSIIHDIFAPKKATKETEKNDKNM